MWQVTLADGRLDANKDHLISVISGPLPVSHSKYIAAKVRAQEAAQLVRNSTLG